MAAAVGEAGAGGAVGEGGDGFGVEAFVEELAAIGFPEVHVELRGGGGEFGEEVGGVGEFCGELFADFGADGEAAGADGGADGGDEVFGVGIEVLAEGVDAVLDDAGEGAAPAGVEGGDGVGAGVGYEDGDAVCGDDAEEDVGVASVEGVAFEKGFAFGVCEREIGCVDAAKDAGVALADGDKGGRGLAVAGEGGDETLAGGEDGGAILFGGVAEILFGRTPGGVGGGGASLTSAEGGEEPGLGRSRRGCG